MSTKHFRWQTSRVLKITLSFLLLIMFSPISGRNQSSKVFAQNMTEPGRLPVTQAGTDTTIAFSDPVSLSTPTDSDETEPSIAVSPAMPTTFLAAMNSAGPFAVHLSDNEGKNWHEVNSPSFTDPAGNEIGHSDPVVAFNTDGNAYITGIAPNVQCVTDILGRPQKILRIYDGGGVFVASGDVISGSSPGITWTSQDIVEANVPGLLYLTIPPDTADPNVAFQDKPWLAIDTSPLSPFQNRVYLVWTTFYGNGDTIIWFSYSPGAGQPFTPKIPVAVAPFTSGKEVSHAYLAVGPTGDLYVIWTEGPGAGHEGERQHTLYMRHSGNGSSFDSGQAIVIGTVNVPGHRSSASEDGSLCGEERWVLDGHHRIGVFPSIAADPTNENRIYAVWNGASSNEDSDVYLSFSDNKGVSWSLPTTINSVTARDQFMPSVTVDKLGTVFVEWYDRKSDPSNLAFVPTGAYSRNGGLTFVEKDLDATSYSGPLADYLQIAALPDGGAVAVWVGDGDAHISTAEYVPATPVDVYMLVDLTSSFFDDLPNFKSQAPAIISHLKAVNPNSRFGLGKFEDYPISPFGSADSGDRAYERLVDLTFDADPVLNTIFGLFTRNGVDTPESQLVALYQAATGAGQNLSGAGFPGASIPPGQQANFRNGASKIFILWTDAPFHRPGDSGTIPYPGPSFDDTVNAILALDPPKVIGISSGGGGRADLEAIASATNAVAPPEGVDCNNDGIVDIAPGGLLVCEISLSGEGIGAAITALVEAASIPSDFNKTSPMNGAVNQPTSVVLRWDASDGATSYEFCYDTTNDNACSSWVDAGNNTSANISGLLDGITYYWHVRAVNSHGIVYSNGTSDAFWSFTTGANLFSILYMTENGGTLRRVDQSTGATTIVGNLGTNSIHGLSNRSGDTTYIYGIYIVGIQDSGLVRINTLTGESTLLPLFDKLVLGISGPIATAIAISPTAPNIAVVAGADTGNANHFYLWKVDVDTGMVLGAAISTDEWIIELAYKLDGSVLYGANSDGQLVTVNSDTGDVTLVGDPGLSDFIEGLAFRPGDGALFAIDAFDRDRLVRLDPADGSLLEVIGNLGVVGPNGLAFIPGYELSVSKIGTGSGVVWSIPSGIECGSTCSYIFNANTEVTLHATASDGSEFTGWEGGDCTDTVDCTVTMDAAKSIAANFVGVGPVTLLAPSGAISSAEPTYTWSADSAATWYHLWIKGPSGKVYDKWYQSSPICSDGTCSVTPPVKLQPGNHTWWIRTWNAAGYGPWSDGMDFTPTPPEAATPVSPAGDIDTNYNPTYTWDKVSDATWYYLWVNGPSGNVIKQWYEASAVCGTSTCSATPEKTLAGGAHTFWVRTWNSVGYGPWSDGMDFSTTILTAPSAATLLSPNAAITDTTPDFTWDKVPSATWYYVWLSKVNPDSSLTTVHSKWYAASGDPNLVCGASSCSITVPGLTLTTGSYRWWIQTWNSAGYGPWSSGMNFSLP